MHGGKSRRSEWDVADVTDVINVMNDNIVWLYFWRGLPLALLPKILEAF